MKNCSIIVLLTLCYCCVNRGNNTYEKKSIKSKWKEIHKRANNNIGYIIDSSFVVENDNELVYLTDSININKSILDSILQLGFCNKNIIRNKYLFNIECYKEIAFNSKKIKIFKIWWMNEDLEIFEFTNYVLYSGEFGLIAKNFHVRGKDYNLSRKVSYTNSDCTKVSFDKFSMKVVNCFK